MKSHLPILMIALAVGAPQAFAAPRPQAATLESVRGEIGAIEKELLTSRQSQLSASGQLKKIRKLLSLQQKEIQLSKKKIGELSTSLGDLSTQKKLLLANIEKRKLSLKSRLRELSKLTEADKLDAGWLADFDAQAQKTYFLERNLKKELADVARLKGDVDQAQNLELRIVEEKNKLDYYVQELGSQMSMLSANEDVQKEIIRTNRSSRLDALQRIKALKDSERELETMLASFRAGKPLAAQAPASQPKTSAIQKPAPAVPLLAAQPGTVLTLSALKGHLPLPVDGKVASLFGRSYNPKTSLLTFQKGITLSAQPGARVSAVSAGKVVFAGPLHNYGLIAIVEHPGQYYTLYGQMGTVAVREGMQVQQGDALGKTDGEPLYFEIRNKNVAINPSQWLTDASTKLTKQ